MRVLGDIPNPAMKITIMGWNQKFLLKFEQAGYEQIYKVSELDVLGLEDLKGRVSERFCARVLERFAAMHEDLGAALE